MGIFFGEVMYGLRYLDLNEEMNEYTITYERKPDISFPIDKATIRKILMDSDRNPTNTERIYQIYTYYITTHTDNSITEKTYMWRDVSVEQLKENGSR